jgi:hypothetical protein
MRRLTNNEGQARVNSKARTSEHWIWALRLLLSSSEKAHGSVYWLAERDMMRRKIKRSTELATHTSDTEVDDELLSYR